MRCWSGRTGYFGGISREAAKAVRRSRGWRSASTRVSVGSRYVHTVTWGESITRIFLRRGWPGTPTVVCGSSRFRRGGVVVATAWIIPGGGRPLEEHGLVMTVPANQLWLVDVYVAERGRGRGLFGALVGLILKNYFSDAAVLWSDVSTGNRPSLAAHRKAGFEDVGGIRSIHVAKSLMVRSWALPAQLSVGGFKAGRQVITTGSAYRLFCSECAI